MEKYRYVIQSGILFLLCILQVYSNFGIYKDYSKNNKDQMCIRDSGHGHQGHGLRCRRDTHHGQDRAEHRCDRYGGRTGDRQGL